MAALMSVFQEKVFVLDDISSVRSEYYCIVTMHPIVKLVLSSKIRNINHILIQCQYIYSHRKVCNYFCNCTVRKASDWTKNTKTTEPCMV